MSLPRQSVEEIQGDRPEITLIKVIFHKVDAFYFLGGKDWESFMETVLNTIMHH